MIDESLLKGGGWSAPARPAPPSLLEKSWLLTAHERLDWAYHLSPHLSFDDQTRFVFFSDCHRGDNGRADIFKPNKALFMRVLNHYFDAGYHYVEVGDGDELWQNREFTAVYRAHRDVYALLHRFHLQGRLSLLQGNHDSPSRLFDPVQKDGLPTYQGLILHYTPARLEIFVTHGHQAAPDADRRWSFNRWTARAVWKWLQQIGFLPWQHLNAPEPGLPEPHYLIALPNWIGYRLLHPARNVEQTIRAWAAARQRWVICGHTHLVACPRPGETPYFNTGSCVNPGFLTGVEIANGQAQLVMWSEENGRCQQTTLRALPLAS
jgi:UDP-2,3-diacylglucosamine pyrophosphatase LpxH